MSKATFAACARALAAAMREPFAGLERLRSGGEAVLMKTWKPEKVRAD
jgi:hypothetical protein